MSEEVLRHIGLAYAVARRIANHPGLDEDDVKQVAVVGLIKAFKTFNASLGFTFSTYAVKVITNEVLGELRRNNRSYCNRFLDESFEDQWVDTNEYRDPEKVAIGTVTLAEVEQALTPKEYSVIQMLYLQNRTQHQVASSLGISQAQVCRIHIRAKDKLRRRLGE